MITARMYITELSKRMLQREPHVFDKGTEKGTKDAIQNLESDSKRNFSGANQLKTRSGYLQRSIKTSVRKNTDGYEGSVGSDAIYAAIHEFGGVITASAKQYLTFKGEFGWVKVKSVTIPPRPFISTAIEKNRESMKQAIIKGINKEMDL